MATYDSYKDSGVKWLGQIPSHWEVKRYKHVFTVRSKKGNPTLPQLCSTQKYGVIPQELYDNRVVIAVKGLELLKLVEVGDFVISLRSFQGGIEYAHYKGIISPAYTILCPIDSSNAGYFRYLLKCPSTLSLLSSMVTGIRQGQNIDYNKLKYEFLPIPPTYEQEAIVAYLDKVTADIDKAIDAQQKMIDALNERKQIIITRAVTRGLNPDAPLRDSGIDWLGQIPEHWETCKLKYFIKIKSGDPISNTQLSDNGEYLVYGGGEPLGRYNQYNIDNGNIVVGRVGARCGCITPIYEKAWATDNALVVSYNGIDFQFLIYCLIAADLNKIASTNAQPLLTGTKVKNTYITVPNLCEQKDIVSYICTTTQNIDLGVSNCKHIISLLQERKQIIINEVVTGKKKVI